MLRLLLCRHGQSTPDLEPRCIEGSGDFPLTDLGRRQGQALAAWLASRYRIDQIVSSPLMRARETAQLVGAATGAPIRL
ncbi:MAG TPA: histidine phosphatase family protein, partial [Symbiobacteriaceae bacterium]|nr:histidine phosphatase family protein [Symbiobacteriaceae bacterium]